MKKREYPLLLTVKVKELNGSTVWKELAPLNPESIDEYFQRMAELLKRKFG